MAEVLSRCWTFYGACVPPGYPFFFNGHCTYCEWDFYEGIILGYIQFDKPSPALCADYPLGWKPAPIKFMTADHRPMFYKFGKSVRPGPYRSLGGAEAARALLNNISMIKKHGEYFKIYPYPDIIPNCPPVVTPETELFPSCIAWFLDRVYEAQN